MMPKMSRAPKRVHYWAMAAVAISVLCSLAYAIHVCQFVGASKRALRSWDYRPLSSESNRPALRLALVRTFTPFDAKVLASSFDYWRKFSPCEHTASDVRRQYEVDLFLSISQTFESHPDIASAMMETIEASRDKWGACFGAVHTLDAGIPPDEDVYSPSSESEDPMWVNGPNTQFRRAVQDIKAKHQYDAMYLMEADSIPYQSFWLDKLADEILLKQPFAILGSKFYGCTWNNALKKQLPIALLNHINGNAVYNMSNPLFNLILDELESEATTMYNALGYDYRISQILTEASLGILPEFPFEAAPRSVTLPPKTAKFRSWWQQYGGKEVQQETALIKNFHTSNFLPSHVGQHTAIVHGKMRRDAWNPMLHKITLVVSDLPNGNPENLLSKLDSVKHPFSEVVLIRDTPATDSRPIEYKASIPLTIYDRVSPHSMDLCEAPVSTDWFLITDSYHEVAQVVDLLFAREGTHKPVVPYDSADAESTCMEAGECRDVIRIAKGFYEDTDKFISDSDLLFHTVQRDSFCEKWMQSSRLKGEGPTATAFVAYLHSISIADQYYSFSDRSIHGSFENFVVSEKAFLENSNNTSVDADLTVVASDSMLEKEVRKDLDLCNVNDKSTCILANNMPFFWQIPKTGGTSLKVLLTSCLNLRDASPRGRYIDKGETLRAVRLGPRKGQSAINVNLATTAGIQRAKQLGLAESGLADVVVSHLFLEASSIFTPENKGVTFAIFRHPVERAASMFHYLQNAEWEKTYNPKLKNLTIEEYAKSRFSEKDWVVRSLVGKLSVGELSTEDLEVAKDIIRRKVIVGLTSDMETTVKRFSEYFGWDLRVAKKGCLERTIYKGHNKNAHSPVVEGSTAWRLLVERNRFDLDLYEYVLDVFEKQGNWSGKKATLVPTKNAGTKRLNASSNHTSVPSSRSSTSHTDRLQASSNHTSAHSSTDITLPFSEFISNVARIETKVRCRKDFAANCEECYRDGGEHACHGQCALLITNGEEKCVTKFQFREETGCGILDRVEPFDPSYLDVNCDNANEVIIGQLLGKGANKIVYKGYWKGRVYAVKMMKSSSEMSTNQIYPPVNLTLKEATLLHGLRGQPNIIPLVGFCNGVGFTELGRPLQDWILTTDTLTPKKRLQYALDIARSVDQLHSIPGAFLVHGDLALKQYYLLENGVVVLGDLDTVKHVGGSSDGEKERCGMVQSGYNRDVAPEQLPGIFKGKSIDDKTDIYSLANMIWSLLAKEKIFQDQEVEELPVKIMNGLRPNVTKLAGYPQSVANVLLECWALTPEDRPTANHVVARIEEALSAMN